MIKYSKYNLILKQMIFLDNLKNSFSFFIVTYFAENGPESGRTIDKTETPPTTETINYLSPEQQKIKDKIDFLEKKYNTLISTGRITKAVADRLLAGLTRDPETKNDPEAKETIDMFNRYRTMFENATREGTEVQLQLAELRSLLFRASNALEYAAGVEYDSSTGEIKEMSLDKDKLKTITNKEFLALAKEERLQHVTKDNIDYSTIKNGNINSVTFFFDQNGTGSDDSDLYRLTTLGQVMGIEVGEIESNGVIYTRRALDGEFFNGNKRLTIHTGTKIEIGKLRTPEELESITQENDLKAKEFLEKNPEFNNEKYIFAINEAIEKDIEPKMFLKILSRRIEEFEKQNSYSKVEIEFISNEITKVPGYDDTGLESTASVFRYLTPTTWKQSLGELGYENADIENYYEANKDDSKYDSGKLENFTPAEYSYPAERSESGTTLCSRTARLNLCRLGVDSPSTGGSARAAYENLNSPKDIFPPTNSDAKVADVYLDARSQKNRQYGHRVAAFKGENGQWFVLDPYYSMFGNTRLPIPAEHYIRTVSDKQQIWGAYYYS